jgi:hypothetical protein
MVPLYHRHVPRAPSPKTGVTCFDMTSLHHVGRHYPLFHRSHRLMRQTKTLLPPSALAWSAGLCRLSQDPAGRLPLPALSLQSLRSCLDPYPATSSRCIYPFLPGELLPHVRSETFGTPNYSHIAASVGHVFQGCSHSVMFRPPCLIGPRLLPPLRVLRAAGPFTPRNRHIVTHMN